LEALAGVGRKTANVVLSVGFGIPAFAVDTHVGRICKHHDIVKKSATPLETENRVMDVLPPERWLPAHQAMIYFGRKYAIKESGVSHILYINLIKNLQFLEIFCF
jgi:endonuclease-3